jgi:glycerate dehydrogenase
MLPSGSEVRQDLCRRRFDFVYTEPIKADNPLLDAPNCNITPHMSWAPKRPVTQQWTASSRTLRTFIAGDPQNFVNK